MAEPRLFTVAEAEATLPLVRRIVRDLVDEFPRWQAAVTHYEVLTGPARADTGESAELRAAREDATLRAERIDAWQRELEQIGCLFKGFEGGLVDFYSLREDRLVFLCWRYGEERIAHWHEVGEGFSGRQPLGLALPTGTTS